MQKKLEIVTGANPVAAKITWGGEPVPLLKQVLVGPKTTHLLFVRLDVNVGVRGEERMRRTRRRWTRGCSPR